MSHEDDLCRYSALKVFPDFNPARHTVITSTGGPGVWVDVSRVSVLRNAVRSAMVEAMDKSRVQERYRRALTEPHDPYELVYKLYMLREALEGYGTPSYWGTCNV